MARTIWLMALLSFFLSAHSKAKTLSKVNQSLLETE